MLRLIVSYSNRDTNANAYSWQSSVVKHPSRKMLLKVCPFCQLDFDEDKIKFHIGVQHLGFHPEAEELNETETNNQSKDKPEEKSMYNCKICSKLLSSAHGLENHMKVVHQSRRLPCEFCGKQVIESRFQNHLINCEIVHYKKYSGRPFQCDKCKKSFSRKSHLSEHQNVHVKVKDNKAKIDSKLPYDCDICSKKLTNYPELISHLKNVHRSPRISCEFCGKLVITKMLQKHLTKCEIVHNEKFSGHPFQCKKCKHSFVMNKNLVRHQKLVHLQSCFSCEFCKQIFAKKSAKKAHVKSRHKIDYESLKNQFNYTEKNDTKFIVEKIQANGMPNVILKKISTKMVEKWRKSSIETKLPVVIQFAKKDPITYADPDQSSSKMINDKNLQRTNPDPSYSCKFC